MSSTQKLEESYQVPSYARFPFAIESGDGSYVTTEDGRKLLDMYGGHAVCGLGHSPKRVLEAIKQQADQLLFYSNLVYSKIRGEAAEALMSGAPSPLTHCFFVNSGAEANENALKLARMQLSRRGVVSFEGGFHGRTAAAIAATANPKIREAAQPVLPDHHYLPFGQLEPLAKILQGQQMAAVLIEPIQSIGGMREAPPQFYQSLRQLCDETGTLLIYDEVQTGMGRIGHPFYAGLHGVVPDMVTLGKSIASGFPMGAVMVSSAINAKISIGDLGSTYGGGPLASAALKATLATIREDGLMNHVTEQFQHLQLRTNSIEEVAELRGRGMLIGIAFKKRSAKEVQKALLEHSIITGTSADPLCLRLLPPLNLNRQELDSFCDALEEVLN